jgi:hypothetical protein
MKTLSRILLPAVVLCALASMASANILVNDTWLDGTRTDPASPIYAENNGITGNDADADGNLESAWFKGGAGTLAPTGSGGPLQGTGLAASSASWTTYFTSGSSLVTLSPYNQLKLTWTFNLVGVNANNASQNLHLGVANSTSAGRLAADGTPANGAYPGYAIWMNMGQTLGNGNPFQLRERTATATSFLNTTADWGTILGNGATSGNVGYTDGTTYTLEWTLTRNGSGGLIIDAKMSGTGLDGDGSAWVTVTDASPAGFSYDIFGIRPSNATSTAATFNTTLFKVEFIPEPSTFALLALGFLGLALRKRS